MTAKISHYRLWQLFVTAKLAEVPSEQLVLQANVSPLVGHLLQLRCFVGDMRERMFNHAMLCETASNDAYVVPLLDASLIISVMNRATCSGSAGNIPTQFLLAAKALRFF